MLVTLLRSLRHSVIVEYAPLTTIGDTIASFLALPDPTSTDRCLLEQDIVRKIPNKLRKPWLRNTNFDWHVKEYLAGLTVHGTCKQCGNEYVGNHDWHYDPEDGGFLCSNCHEGYVCKKCAEKNPKNWYNDPEGTGILCFDCHEHRLCKNCGGSQRRGYTWSYNQDIQGHVYSVCQQYLNIHGRMPRRAVVMSERGLSDEPAFWAMTDSSSTPESEFSQKQEAQNPASLSWCRSEDEKRQELYDSYYATPLLWKPRRQKWASVPSRSRWTTSVSL